MINQLREGSRYLAIAVITALSCMGLLFLAPLVPQETIQENCIESARYFKEAPIFENAVGEFIGGKRDNYADCILMNIAYHLDERHPITSAITSSYYYTEVQNEKDNFYDAVMEPKDTTKDYFRYWHGSLIYLRPLSAFFSITEIRMTLLITVVLLQLGVLLSLCLHKRYSLAVMYLISLMAVDFLLAGICIEYANVFLIQPIVTMIAIQLAEKNESEDNMRRKAIGLFLATGIVTCFMDFLSSETLTYTIPFFLMYYINRQKNKQASSKRAWYFFLQSGLAWLIGYAGMFLLKWGLSAVVLGTDAFFEATKAARVRINSPVHVNNFMESEIMSVPRWIAAVFYRNLGGIFHATDDTKANTMILISIATLLLIAIFWYFFRKPIQEKKHWGLVLLLGLIPYIRYLVLMNHSYLHYFFTYRAQMITVLTMFCFLYETTFVSEWIFRRKSGKMMKYGTKWKK